MKSKGGSLYEVLKSASRPGGADDAGAPAPDAPAAAPEGGPQPTLQERLAAYKAAKLAAATSGTALVESAPAKPPAATVVLEPDPTPIPAPAPTRAIAPPPAPASVPAPVASTVLAPAPAEDSVSAAPEKGPGERVLKVTYNTALFVGMIAVGLLFIAYAVGLHNGKTSASAEAAPVVKAPSPLDAAAPSKPPAPTPAPPAAPVRKEYAIRLGEWKYGTAQERLRALAIADDPDLKKQLERGGHKSYEKAFITRNGEVKMALYVDRFNDVNSDAAKAALTAMKTFKFKNATPFPQAAFEEVQPR